MWKGPALSNWHNPCCEAMRRRVGRLAPARRVCQRQPDPNADRIAHDPIDHPAYGKPYRGIDCLRPAHQYC